jgi:FemAB-related protein (PEP-CTERM system-associated)
VQHGSSPPAAWNAFVGAAAQSSFCHLAGWGHVLGETLRLEPVYLWTEDDDGSMTGVLPLVRMPTLRGGSVLISMPYLNYGGPVGGEDECRALARAAISVARAKRDRKVELRTRWPVVDDLESGTDVDGPTLAPAREKVTVLLDLPDDATVLFEDHFRSKLRSQVRRPMKEDMEARFGRDEVAAFYGVFRENMRDLGTPVLPRRFFEALAETFGEWVEFGAVYHEGLPVAAGCGFHWGDEFEMTWASSLRAYNRLSPNMLLYWRFMERCISAGRGTFNFGRSTPGEGTHRFKLQWGGEDQPLHWRQWPPGAGGPDAESPFFRLATRVWQRLPLRVAGALGPLVARRISAF